MDWSETRRKLLQMTAGRRARPEEEGISPERTDEEAATEPVRPRATSICIASGKGGTGKSVVTASLAMLLARRGKVLIVDADLGVGNAHILQDVAPQTSFVDVVEGRLSVADVRVPCSSRVDLIAAGSGVPRMADLSTYELHLIATGLEELEFEYRYVLVDSAAGISNQTLAFAGASDAVLIVTTPDLTAMTDAYAFVKVLTASRPDLRPLLLVNRARSEEEARDVTERMCKVCERFLAARPLCLGWLPDDPVVPACVNRRGSVNRLEPEAPAAAALERVEIRLRETLELEEARGLGRSMLDEVGYSPRFA